MRSTKISDFRQGRASQDCVQHMAFIAMLSAMCHTVLITALHLLGIQLRNYRKYNDEEQS